MVKKYLQVVVSTIVLSALYTTSDSEETAVYLWQKKQLLAPDESTVKYEKEKQKVFIYEGLTVADVEKALDQHFDRVEHMMFVGTVLPPTSAGVPQTEDDGCE